MKLWDRIPRTLSSWVCGLVCLVAAVAGSLYTCVTFDFVSLDDNVNVFGNPWLNRPLAEALARFWRAPYESLYIPVPYTLWRFLAGGAHALYQNGLVSSSLSPSLFHGLNLALHLVNTLLVIAILSRLIPGRLGPVLLGATFFALHPIQMETVAWISCLRDLVAYSLGLSAILLLMKAHPSKIRIISASIFFLLAILSKPNAVGLPFVAGLIWSASGCWIGRWRWGLLILWSFCLIPVIVINKSQQLDGGLQFVPSLWQRPWIAWDAIHTYICHILRPFDLTPDYGRSPASVIAQPWRLAQILTPLVPLGIALLTKHKKQLITAYLVFLFCLGPTLGLISFQYQEFSTVTDRYAYLAMLGVGWYAALLLAEVPSRPVVWGIIGITFVTCSILSREQLAIWKNSATLFSHGLRVTPRSKIMAFSMGNLHYEAGRYDQAEYFFRIVAEEWPGLSDVHLNLATVYASSQRFDLALKEIAETLRLAPQEGQALHLKGMVLSHLGQRDAARTAFEDHLALKPSGVIAVFSRAMLFMVKGELAAAIQDFEQVLSSQPANRAAMYQLVTLNRQLAAAAEANGITVDASKYREQAAYWQQRADRISIHR